MLLIWLGALLIICGVALAAIRTARRGRLSDATPRGPDLIPDSLEPKGRGDRLNLMTDLPGLALMGIGAVLLLLGAVI